MTCFTLIICKIVHLVLIILLSYLGKDAWYEEKKSCVALCDNNIVVWHFAKLRFYQNCKKSAQLTYFRKLN